MEFPKICFISNTIQDISDRAAISKTNSLVELRRFVKILIIDDNEFGPEVFLKKNGYQIQHKLDIDSIQDVEPYDIVLCDISGVGKKLGYTKEGAFIIREIHNSYPNKRVIAYTAYTFDTNYNEYFSFADFVAPKDLSIDDWINVLDEQVKKSIDPVEQWMKIRNNLIEKNVSTLEIAKIEDRYVKAVKNVNFDKFCAFIDRKNIKLTTVVKDFLSSLCAKVILGSLGV